LLLFLVAALTDRQDWCFFLYCADTFTGHSFLPALSVILVLRGTAMSSQKVPWILVLRCIWRTCGIGIALLFWVVFIVCKVSFIVCVALCVVSYCSTIATGWIPTCSLIK
jgi:hypothetical protein